MTAAEQIKIVLVGNSGVGKTCIINWYQNNIQDTKPTIGASCTDMLVEINGVKTNLNIWDTAGQLEYRDLMPLYFRDACVILICFAADNEDTFNAIKDWDNLVVNRAPESAVKIIVCNKIDLEKVPMPSEKMVNMQHEIGAIECFRTSAMTGEGINYIFEYIKNTPGIPRDRQYMPNLTGEEKINLSLTAEHENKCC